MENWAEILQANKLRHRECTVSLVGGQLVISDDRLKARMPHLEIF